MEWTPDLELRGCIVVARPYRLSDVDELFSAARESLREVGPWLPWCHENYSRTDSEEWVRGCEQRWRVDESYDFALLDAQDGRYCGGVGINLVQRNYRMANLGYWVRSSETGRGIATEAARLVAGFGFDVVGLERIEIVVATENHASVKVAERAGARREAVLRRRLQLHGKGHDAVMLSILREDLADHPAC